MTLIHYFYRATALLLVAALGGLLGSLLGGCASPGSIAVNSSADALLQKLGKPTEVRSTTGGGEAWDYAYGPAGYTTWRYVIDGRRVVHSAEQILTEERFYKIVIGRSKEADVIEQLGQPRLKQRTGNSIAWEWRVILTHTPGIYYVAFGPDGVVNNQGTIMDVVAPSEF